MAGLQVDFEERLDKDYQIFEEEGYKIAIEEDLLEDNDYFEIKHSNNFLARGFYVSHVKPS